MIKSLIAYGIMLVSTISCMFISITNIWWLILIAVMGLCALVWMCVFIINKEEKEKNNEEEK